MARRTELNQLMAMLKKLPSGEQKKLVDQIMGMMQTPDVKEKDGCNRLVKEHTFKDEKPDCPHCRAKANQGFIIKKGLKRGVQRYFCKSCVRFFVATTNTVFEGSHKAPSVWEKFIRLTISGASIKKCADECELCIQTAFTWRHKILHTFRLHQDSASMAGQIELDEMLIPISYKGNHVRGEHFHERRLSRDGSNNNMPRESYKRGSDNKSISSKNKACVFCMVKNGNEGFYAVVPGVGFMDVDKLDATLGRHVKKENSMILADQYKVTAGYLKANSYEYMLLASNTTNVLHGHKPEIRGDKHLQHVNAMHMHIRRFLRPYCGVSTKYLENYISLFVWLKNVAARKQKKQTHKVSVSRLAASDCYISRKGLEAFPAIPCYNTPVQSQVINPNWVVCEEIPF